MLIQRVPWRIQPHQPRPINPKWGALAVGYFLRDGSIALATNSPGAPIEVVEPITPFGVRTINTEGGCLPTTRFTTAQAGSGLTAPVYLANWKRPYTIIIRTPLTHFGTGDNEYPLLQASTGSGYGAMVGVQTVIPGASYRNLRLIVSDNYTAVQSLTYQAAADVPAKTYAFVWYGGAGIDLFGDGELLQQSTGNTGSFGGGWYSNGPLNFFPGVSSYSYIRPQSVNIAAFLPYAATQQQLMQLAGHGVWDLLAP